MGKNVALKLMPGQLPKAPTATADRVLLRVPAPSSQDLRSLMWCGVSSAAERMHLLPGNSCRPQPASPGGPGVAALGTVNAKRLRDPSFSMPVPLWATLKNEGIDMEPQSEKVQAPET